MSGELPRLSAATAASAAARRLRRRLRRLLRSEAAADRRAVPSRPGRRLRCAPRQAPVTALTSAAPREHAAAGAGLPRRQPMAPRRRRRRRNHELRRAAIASSGCALRLAAAPVATAPSCGVRRLLRRRWRLRSGCDRILGRDRCRWLDRLLQLSELPGLAGSGYRLRRRRRGSADGRALEHDVEIAAALAAALDVIARAAAQSP